MPKIHDQDENERQWNKKANKNTCEIFFRKRSTRKFQVQNKDKGNVQKSQCCTRKHDFANETYCLFFRLFLPHCLALYN